MVRMSLTSMTYRKLRRVSDVTFTYEVSNTGNVAFAKDDVKVIDDNGTASDTSDDFEATLRQR
jgi:hypothetical protein